MIVRLENMTNKCGYPDCKEDNLSALFGCVKHWVMLPTKLTKAFLDNDPGFPGRIKAVDEIVAFWTKHWEESDHTRQSVASIIRNEKITATDLSSLHPEGMNIGPVTITEDSIIEAIEDLESSLCRAARDLERLKRLINC